ncbi:AraC family transcriptional regulator [Deinococcus sp. KSM4-11]|uniref:AraC family transcriptional regulator n=1 Tax=Deinococcus sp. KSM4-11 TaxID=2568654 RepID=UPI0010A2D02B|nr:AraC family transcriptional regulator [Deinococcus sp. KSM4-11]THF87384.1 AraC family transcriptional regulator [Deinococcus sp. KSM4-11]
MSRESEFRPILSASPHRAPERAELLDLAALLGVYAPYDGSHALRVPNAYAVRSSRMNAELFHSVYQPSVCIVAQGTKTVFLGPNIYEYDAQRLLVFSLELPMASQVTQASAAEPYLCLKLNFDPAQVARLSGLVYPHGLPPIRENRGVYVGDSTAGIVATATRLLTLMADEGDATLIGPLVVEELIIRLLRSSVGGRIAQIGHEESTVQRVAKAVDWVRAHFDQPMDVPVLAEMVHMSPSTFHEHFKSVTSLSPLQFQKALRLREARRLMLTGRVDATTASRQVGYASASQFTREYGRLFGLAPSRDIAQLREHGPVSSAAN